MNRWRPGVELRMQSNKSVDCQIGLMRIQQFDEPTDPYIDPSKMRKAAAVARRSSVLVIPHLTRRSNLEEMTLLRGQWGTWIDPWLRNAEVGLRQELLPVDGERQPRHGKGVDDVKNVLAVVAGFLTAAILSKNNYNLKAMQHACNKNRLGQNKLHRPKLGLKNNPQHQRPTLYPRTS